MGKLKAKISGDTATSATSSPKAVKPKKKTSALDRIRQKYKKDEPKPAKSVKIKPPTKPKQAPADQPEPFYGGRMMRIATPAGSPPCSPKGYSGGVQPYYKVKEPWPDGQPDSDDVLDWAHKVRDEGISNRNVYYTTDAIVYFARFFWDINGPVYPQIKEVLQSAFE
tara:strand:+ start:745 stop:1245 length:501 start_codon:yes stop_codon:yes gene_type:complete